MALFFEIIKWLFDYWIKCSLGIHDYIYNSGVRTGKPFKINKGCIQYETDLVCQVCNKKKRGRSDVYAVGEHSARKIINNYYKKKTINSITIL